MVSGSISLRSQRFFSPFPRGTCSLSVADEYLALRGGPRGFALRSTCDVLLRIPGHAHPDFAYAALTLSGSLSQVILLSVQSTYPWSFNPAGLPAVWALPLSLATTYGIDFSFFSSAY